MEIPTRRNTRSIRVTSRRPLQGRSRRQNNNPVILNDDDAEPQNVSCIDLTDLDADFIDLTSPAPNDASIIILPGTESTEPRARPRTSRRGSRTRRQSDRVNLDDSENDVIEISESYQALPLPLSFEDAGNESFNANDSLRSPRQEISCPICMDNKKQVTQELFSAARNIRENAKEGMQMIRQFANSLNANSNTHSCNHGNRNVSNHVHQPTPDHNHCPNGVSMPTTVNNVSVGTSTVCMEPNCNNHCGDDNCDSVDDSCSEQSSSTSTSNQKEGKYCDCCYCEFFGHGNPPVAPTSKNYEEMRNRLRLRLKRKQQSEKKQDPHYQNCIMANSNHNNNSPARPVKVVPVQECPKEDPVAGKGLDELLNFINGTENKDQAPEKSSKALKRARQKQRKAEEKARMEAERIKKEQEEAEKERQRLAMIEVVIGAPLDTLSNAEGYSKTGNIYLCPIRLDKNRSDVTECSELNLPDVGKIDFVVTLIHEIK
uniref:Uncharacterized protein C4orf8-like protein n=1 Tax=Magallana gigas TaxID=29159 RepID=K1R2M9_MAGGI